MQCCEYKFLLTELINWVVNSQSSSSGSTNECRIKNFIREVNDHDELLLNGNIENSKIEAEIYKLGSN